MFLLRPDQIALADEYLQKGELVAFPTETVLAWELLFLILRHG